MTTAMNDLIKICARYCVSHGLGQPSEGAGRHEIGVWLATVIRHAELHNGAILAQMVINANRRVDEERTKEDL
jgi:hypothetical protein